MNEIVNVTTYGSETAHSTTNLNTLRYANADDPDTQKEYELTFEDKNGYRSINWVSDFGGLKMCLSEMRSMGQKFITIRKVYVKVAKRIVFDTDLLLK